MKLTEAPAYIRSYDLAKWLLEQSEKFPRHRRIPLATRLQNDGLTLVEEISLALTFRENRCLRLQLADEAMVRLRTTLRLTGECHLLSARQVRFAVLQLEEIGRMVGGWKRQAARQEKQGKANTVLESEASEGRKL